MAALQYVLAGLTAGGSKLIWDKYLKTSTNTPYDIVIRINSLLALKTTGWEIALGENTKNVIPTQSTPESTRGLVVAVLGSYNRGKSFLLNQLCDITLPSGNLIYTEGISITAPKEDQLDDKKATEALLREIALHLCSFIIIVVNRLRATDQTYIQQVLSHTKDSKQEKDIIIVHNLVDVETIEDVSEIVKKEVENLFEAKEDRMTLPGNKQSAPVIFFRSENTGIKLRHFILTKNGSNAAEIWNRQTLDGIMTILQTATHIRRDLNVINEMISFVNTKLPQIFTNNDENGNNSNDNNQPKFQIQLHARKPNIVLSQRIEMEDLQQNPSPLTLSPKLAYDEAGYFMGFSSMDSGQWQPRYSLYESNDDIYAFIELAGFKKEHVKVKVIEKAILLEGCREDFKTSLVQQSTMHHERIPFGQFKLDIPLNCEIEHKQAKLERDDGLYKIKCPKKKDTETYLE